MNESWFSINAFPFALLVATSISFALALLALSLEMAPKTWRLERLIYGLWILVLLRLMLIAGPASSLSILNLFPNEDQRGTAGTCSTEFCDLKIPDSLQLTLQTPVVSTDPRSENSLGLVGSIGGWSLLFIWGVGLFLLLRRTTKSILATQKIVTRSAEIATSNLYQRLSSAILKVNVPQVVAVRITTDFPVPAVVGLLRPTILIPRWCAQELTQEQLELVITHELVHIRRKDLLVQWLAHLIRIIHWFNPLVYLATAKLDHWREINCDLKVLTTFNDDRIKSKLYMETLIQVFTRASSEHQRHGLAVGFIGVTNVRRDTRNFIERIQMLQQPIKRSHRATALAAIVLASVFAVGFTSAQVSETNELWKKICYQEKKDAKDEKEGRSENSTVIRLTVYKGDGEKVASVLESMKLPSDFCEHGGVVDLGPAGEELQLNFKALVKDFKSNQISVVTLYGLSVQISQGKEIPREIANGKFENVFVGHQFNVTPSERNGKTILGITLSQSEINPGATISVGIADDGSPIRVPQVFCTEKQLIGVLNHPDDSLLIGLGTDRNGERTLVEIECVEPPVLSSNQ